MTLELCRVGSPLSILPRTAIARRPRCPLALSPCLPPLPEGGCCSPTDSASDLGRTPFRPRWVVPQASACLLERGEVTKPCPLASPHTEPSWVWGASHQSQQPPWQGSTGRPTLAHSQEHGQTAHSASILSSRTLSRQLGAWTQEVWDQTLDVVTMGARAPSPNNRQISSSREAESVFDIFMRLWINVWFQPLTCRRNRKAREEFGCRIGSTSLTILEVIWDAHQGEHDGRAPTRTPGETTAGRLLSGLASSHEGCHRILKNGVSPK